MKTLIEECRIKTENSYNIRTYDDFERGIVIGGRTELKDVIDRLEKLIKS